MLAGAIPLFLQAQPKDVYQKYGIHRDPLRLVLNQFSFTLTTGYGYTQYHHDLVGFYYYQDRQGQYILRNDQELGPVFDGYQGWFNNPRPGGPRPVADPYDVPFDYLPAPVNNPLINNQQYIVDADSIELSFSGGAHSIPFAGIIHYDYQKFRGGFGFSYERQFLQVLKPSVNRDIIQPLDPGVKSTGFFRWYGLLGYQFYEYWDYTFVAEIQAGRINYGRAFDSPAVRTGWNYNLGVNIEKNLSEYVRVVVKPSYDIKSYVVTLPDASSIRHYHPTFAVTVGLSINIPEIPRSPYRSDHVQLKHVIVDPETGELTEVRGQPIWKKQNPKVGENHRKLWRYKWRNRRKLDPY